MICRIRSKKYIRCPKPYSFTVILSRVSQAIFEIRLLLTCQRAHRYMRV
jgi:hypothetical protein